MSTSANTRIFRPQPKTWKRKDSPAKAGQQAGKRTPKIHRATLAVAYHLRQEEGVFGKNSPVLTTTCTGLEDIFIRAQAQFPDFHRRNPWIFVDSSRNQVVVLLDSEEVNSKSKLYRAGNKGRN